MAASLGSERRGSFRHRVAGVVAAALVASALVTSPAIATPVKCEEGDVTPDDRVFPEPNNSTSFLRFDEFECAIEFLERQHSDLIEVTTIGKSLGGRPIYD